jgi:perosamine synthetase
MTATKIDLAVTGGAPVRAKMLPYGHQSVDESDIAAVVDVLRSDWLTTGPKVDKFEAAFADKVGSKEAVAVSSGTAALHTAVAALDIRAGDEVIVPAMTFAATANCVLYQEGTPVFADVNPDTLLVDPADVEAKITPRTRAVIAVDFAGQPCDYDALNDIAARHGIALLADASHALGARYINRPVGSLANLTTFSFHPVKHVTTGEGGSVTTNSSRLAHRMRMFRNHGIASDHRQRQERGAYFYEMTGLGYNYRLSDIQCALGLSQLRKLEEWIARRQQIAAGYDAAFGSLRALRPLRTTTSFGHAYHLYIVRLEPRRLTAGRDRIFSALRAEGIGVNVHYIPVHLHPFYRERFGTGPGLCPAAEAAYESILSLPIFPAMTAKDVNDVIEAVYKVIEAFSK